MGMIGGSVCESNTPTTSRRRRAPVLKTGRITGPHALPLSLNHPQLNTRGGGLASSQSVIGLAQNSQAALLQTQYMDRPDSRQIVTVSLMYFRDAKRSIGVSHRYWRPKQLF